MSKQTQLAWASASSSSSARGQRANGGSKDDRDLEMKEQPAHTHNRTIYRASRSSSGTASLSHSTSTSPTQAPPASVLGKRGSGRPSPFVFLDGADPLDYTDFAQTKLAMHTLLYLCADSHYSHKHIALPAEAEEETAQRQPEGKSGGSGGGEMDVEEKGARGSAAQPVGASQEPTADAIVRYDSLAPADEDGLSQSRLFSHHPFHRFHRSHKAALAAWKQMQGAGGEKDGSSGSGRGSGRVMEFACREPLQVLHVSAQQRAAVFASSASASSSSSTSSDTPPSSLPSPPPLLAHLLSTHNGCVGYEVEGEEAAGVVLTSYACECQLSLLDDDKRAKVSQALLTDMFARLHC